MSEDERIEVCKAVAVSCMWGHGGVGANIIERLEKALPSSPSWRELFNAHQKAARRESVGVITEERRLSDYLSRGYRLANWDEDGCSLFNPPPMNGLAAYVDKVLADKYAHTRGY